MNLNKQAGFSMIEIALAMCMITALLCVTILLASPKNKNEQPLAKEQSETMEKDTPVLEENVLKSVH